MNEIFKLALREEILKLGGETPGALAPPVRVQRSLGVMGKSQQKGLPNMGGTVGNGASTGTPVGKVSKGMGVRGAPTPPATSSGYEAKIGSEVLPVPKMKLTFDAMRPKMTIDQKPKPASPDKITLAYPTTEDALRALGLGAQVEIQKLASPEARRGRLLDLIQTLEDLEGVKTAEEALPLIVKLAEIRKEAGFAMSALRAAGGLGSRMLRSKAMWGLAAAGGAAYGAGKLFKSTVDMASAEKGRQDQVMQQTGQNP